MLAAGVTWHDAIHLCFENREYYSPYLPRPRLGQWSFLTPLAVGQHQEVMSSISRPLITRGFRHASEQKTPLVLTEIFQGVLPTLAVVHLRAHL